MQNVCSTGYDADMAAYKLKKAFDCQKMPQDVKCAFFEATDYHSYGNDVYVNWYVSESAIMHNEPAEEDDCAVLNGWLKEQGVGPDDCPVIIRRWW